MAENGTAENVKVFCRVRRQEGTLSQIKFGEDGASLTVPDVEKPFCFDRVFQADASQREVYECVAQPVVEDVLEGINGTVFAYGQTNSGKTYTMEGNMGSDERGHGIIPRIAASLFEGIARKGNHVEFHVKVSVVEIYRENIRDLLDPSKNTLKIFEGKGGTAKLVGATESYAACAEEVLEVLRVGMCNRAVGRTDMNEHSSRSHLVFMIMLEQRDLLYHVVTVSKLHLVDLAGSELMSKSFRDPRGTDASRMAIEETKSINKSLSALGNVIRALAERIAHVPYRDSKLTRMLKQSLGGYARTALIVACSPALDNELETLSTLRFGQRAKMIENHVKVNAEFVSEGVLLVEAYQQVGVLMRILHENVIPVPEDTLKFARRVVLESGQSASNTYRTPGIPEADSATVNDDQGLPEHPEKHRDVEVVRDEKDSPAPSSAPLAELRKSVICCAALRRSVVINDRSVIIHEPDSDEEDSDASTPSRGSPAEHQLGTEDAVEVLRDMIRKSVVCAEWDPKDLGGEAAEEGRRDSLNPATKSSPLSGAARDPFSVQATSSLQLLELGDLGIDRVQSCLSADSGHMNRLLQELDTKIARLCECHKTVANSKVQLHQALQGVRETRWQLEKEALGGQAGTTQAPEAPQEPDNARGSLSGNVRAGPLNGGRDLDADLRRVRLKTSVDSDLDLDKDLVQMASDLSFCGGPQIARPVRGGESSWGMESFPLVGRTATDEIDRSLKLGDRTWDGNESSSSLATEDNDLPTWPEQRGGEQHGASAWSSGTHLLTTSAE